MNEMVSGNLSPSESTITEYPVWLSKTSVNMEFYPPKSSGADELWVEVELVNLFSRFAHASCVFHHQNEIVQATQGDRRIKALTGVRARMFIAAMFVRDDARPLSSLIEVDATGLQPTPKNRKSCIAAMTFQAVCWSDTATAISVRNLLMIRYICKGYIHGRVDTRTHTFIAGVFFGVIVVSVTLVPGSLSSG